MSFPSQTPDPAVAATEPRSPWRRRNNGFALAVAVIVHLILLVVVLTWRSRVSLPIEPRSLEVSLMEVQQPPPKPLEPPPPPPKVPEPPPPSLLPVPELPPVEPPKVEPVPQAAAPEVAPAPPAVSVAPPPPPPPPAPSPAVPPKLFEECADSPDRQMVADVYRLRQGTGTLSEMRRRKPIKTVCLAQLDVTPRDFNEGFPGLDMTEWFGLDIRFTVNVPEDGAWELMLLSDDGSILTVDDVEVINNDGIHAATPVMTTVKMAKGLRNFRVRYFQGPGSGLALMLGWKKPGVADFQYIPRRLLGRPAVVSAAAG
jgi:hypothetical protein